MNLTKSQEKTYWKLKNQQKENDELKSKLNQETNKIDLLNKTISNHDNIMNSYKENMNQQIKK